VNVTQAVAQTTSRVIRSYAGAPGQAPVTRVPGGAQLQPQADRVAVQAWQDLDANRTAVRNSLRANGVTCVGPPEVAMGSPHGDRPEPGRSPAIPSGWR
jgi:hypothetical protein